MKINAIQRLICKAREAGVISIKEGVFLSTGKSIKEKLLVWDEASSSDVLDDDLWIYTEQGLFMPLGQRPERELNCYV
ncbi:hypothetical protein PDM28_11480 [Stenotrophomonas aracearum]|uniref:Uncharacterized protein n=1 Tax=Stenotrophomonas aracearum TaxID=3003272 RepID=A0ABY9Y8X3_9GAMM|nr:hypothetical protein [Stenotrophomonas sp. A5588]WNH47322.1 hypothetical protein PDM28_11480 [Stenotrophomonas sp. A5588]